MTREEAEYFLRGISYKLGNIAVEYLSEKDGEKMREAIKALEQEPTTNNDLGVDCIDRDSIKYYPGQGGYMYASKGEIDKLPSVTPQESVLDKIRAEIEMEKLEDSPNFCIKAHNNAIDRVLQIIDKYKAESEEDFTDECKRLDGDCDKCTHKYHCCSSERNGRH